MLCAIAAPGFALSINELDVNASLMLIGNTSSYGDVSPIVQVFGASLPLKLAGPFYIEPKLEFFGLLYQWVDANAIAVPTQIETATGFWTLATLISMHAGGAMGDLPESVSGWVNWSRFSSQIPDRAL